MSLAVLESGDRNRISDLTRDYFVTFTKLSIEFSAIALIPGQLHTVFLVPVGNIDLLELQRTLFRLLEDSGHSHLSRYEPGKWLPHCSISKELSASEALKTVEICQNFGKFRTATVAEAGFIEFRPRKEIKNYFIT